MDVIAAKCTNCNTIIWGDGPNVIMCLCGSVLICDTDFDDRTNSDFYVEPTPEELDSALTNEGVM